MEENKKHQDDLERKVFGLSMLLAKQLKEEQKLAEPDYWTRLEHQYAGMAMQQLVHLVNVGYEYVYEETAIIAMNFAHALVEKLKEKEEK